MSSEQPSPPAIGREARFVHGVIEQCQRDKGLAARLRRANNPATEYQSWELLARYGIDLERNDERLPFASVAAAIAKAKIQSNGSLTLGRAIANCYPDSNQNDQAKARLRRLLACDEVTELCRLLRPVLTLIDNRVPQPLDYARLLGQLRRFAFAPQQVQTQWAQEFYGNKAAAEEQA